MPKKRPVIVFLTAPWADIDDRIRTKNAPGGVPSVSRIWTECLRNGYEVHVFITTFLEEDWPRQTTELGGVTFHWINMPCQCMVRWLQRTRLIGATKIFSIIWQEKMRRRVSVSSIKPDIIYLMRPTFALVGLWWAKRTAAKVVLRQYGTWIYHYWGNKGHYFDRFQTLGEYIAMKLPMDLIIMTNDGTMGDKAAALAGVPVDKFRFWINGVDKNLRINSFNGQEAKARMGIPPDAPVVMTLGRLAFWKRLDRVIEAMPRVIRKFPSVRLVIVGDGPLRQELEAQTRNCGINNHVLFVGAISHREIKQYLNMCDIFVISNDLSNMCNTLLEAITCGKCVVTRDVGDTKIIAKHNVNSIVLLPGEADDYAEAILNLLLNPERRRALAEKAHSWAMNNLQTWDQRMAMEVQELNQLIGYEYVAMGKPISGEGCLSLPT